MIFRPDIKPPMWGPPDAVQFAVRQNAEQMGIAYSDIKAFLPMWESGGQSVANIVGKSYQTFAEWSNQCLYFNSNSDLINLGNLFYSNELTIFCVVSPDAGTSGDQAHIVARRDWNISGGNEYTLLGNSSVQALTLIYWSGVGYSVAGELLVANKKNSVSGSIGSTEIYVMQEGVVTGTAPRGGVIDNKNIDLTIGALKNNASRYFKGGIDTVLITSKDIGVDALTQLHHEQYALLMPVVRPFIFDMAGGIFAIDSVLQSQGVTAPAVNQKISVTISSVTQSQSVDTQTASQMHTVSPANVTQSQSVDAQTVTQLVTLSLADVSQSQTVETPTLTQTHGITTDSVSQSQSATPLTAEQLHEIITANVGQSQTLNSVTVSITGALVIHSVTQSQSAGNLSLDQLIALAVDSVLQGQTIDEPSLATINLINIDDVSQSQSLGTVSLSQVSALIIDAINQGQQIENVTFIAKGRVTVTIEARSPGVNFNARKPGITFN